MSRIGNLTVKADVISNKEMSFKRSNNLFDFKSQLVDGNRRQIWKDVNGKAVKTKLSSTVTKGWGCVEIPVKSNTSYVFWQQRNADSLFDATIFFITDDEYNILYTMPTKFIPEQTSTYRPPVTGTVVEVPEHGTKILISSGNFDYILSPEDSKYRKLIMNEGTVPLEYEYEDDSKPNDIEFKSDIGHIRTDGIEYELDYENEQVVQFPYVNKTCNDIGEIIDGNKTALSDLIPLHDVVQIYRKGPDGYLVHARYFYDANKEYIGRDTVTSDSDPIFGGYRTINGIDNCLTVPIYKGASYIRLQNRNDDRLTYVIVKSKNKTYVVNANISCNNFKTLQDKCNDAIRLNEKVDLLLGNQKKVVLLGDSIMKYSTVPSVGNLMRSHINHQVIEGAYGGTRMIRRSENLTNEYAAFDLPSIADSIASGDWSRQNNVISSTTESTILNQYVVPTQNLRELDFNTVDYILFNHGINDSKDNSLDNIDKYKQSMEYCVGKIQSAFPHIQVIAISPTWKGQVNDGTFTSCSNDTKYPSTAAYTIKEYAEAMMEKAKELNIPFIDAYDIGINKFTYKNYFDFETTGEVLLTHQNEKGRRLLARIIANKLIEV